jgi:hypothetical protein
MPAEVFDAQRGWRGEELAGRFDLWGHRLGDAELDELDRAVRHLEGLDKPLPAIEREDFELVTLRPAIERWMNELRSGRGFVLVRGFPVDRYSDEQAALAYWLLGRHMGEPVSQNTDGDLLGHVRDTGADPRDHDVRLYKTREALSFHTDGADLIGLLCLRPGRSGGTSRICSSIWLYNEIARRRPELAPLLFQPWHHHAHGQFGPEGPATFELPILTVEGAVFRMFLLPWYLRNAAADFPDLVRLDAPRRELLDLLESLPEEPGVALDMQFEKGDFQFLKNSVVLHARSAYEDFAEPERKRHLLRLWLSVPSFYDGDEILRAGIAPREAEGPNVR